MEQNTGASADADRAATPSEPSPEEVSGKAGIPCAAKLPQKIRVRKTPNALHPYYATTKGTGTYGWGNSAAEARECLVRRLAEQVSA